MSVYKANSSWHLLKPRPKLGALKTLDSADVELNILPNGATELTIYHDLLKGMSPRMLVWWFRNIAGEIEVGGQYYTRYQIWHPYDHIHWQLAQAATNGTIGVGAKFYIVEAFGGNMEYLVNSIETVTRLDESGITLNKVALGQEFFSLAHDFIPETGGTRYVSRMVVGFSSLLGQSMLNAFIRWRMFPEEMGRAWLTHNIEEVGNFENFLPRLWDESQERDNLAV